MIAHCAQHSAHSSHIWKACPTAKKLWSSASRIVSHIECCLVPSLAPSFPLLAVRTTNNGKVDMTWGTRLVIFKSVYELSCVHVPLAAWASSVMEWSSCKPKWLKILMHFLSVKFVHWFAAFFWDSLAYYSSYTYNFKCIQNVHVHISVAKNLTSLATAMK